MEEHKEKPLQVFSTSSNKEEGISELKNKEERETTHTEKKQKSTTEEDSIAPARILIEFLKKYDKGIIKAGLIDGSIVKDSDIKKISKLPNKQELYAKLASYLNAPVIKLARTLNYMPLKFVRVVDALRKEKEGEAN